LTNIDQPNWDVLASKLDLLNGQLGFINTGWI
jgi:hypothetical protein